MNMSSSILANQGGRARNAGPYVLLLVGFVTAFGAGKLPPVLPEIRATLQISLLDAGILVSSFQVAGALIGMLVGAMADRFGHRRLILAGLIALLAGSTTGALADQISLLLVSRAMESVGFAMASLPVPALLRAIVPPVRLSRWLGWWGTYMPVGFALGLVVSPWLAAQFDWRAAWVLHILLSAMAIGLLLRFVPARLQSGQATKSSGPRLLELIQRTVRSAGPWICAVVFACYAGAYLSIVGFLPTIYQQGGLEPTNTGLLTALVAVINVTGNVTSGHLIHRGVPAHYLIAFATGCLLIGSWLTYAASLPFAAAFASVCAVSAVMGLIPGSLFYLVNRYVRDERIVSASVGLMQQGSSIGQLTIPVVVAAVVGGAAGWANTFWVIAGLCAVIFAMTVVMHRFANHHLRSNSAAR